MYCTAANEVNSGAYGLAADDKVERADALVAYHRALASREAVLKDKNTLRLSAEAYLSLFNRCAATPVVTHILKVATDTVVSIDVNQSPVDGVGGLVWPCGEVLAELVSEGNMFNIKPRHLQSATVEEDTPFIVCELGCGIAALPSIAAAASCQCSVVATDTADILIGTQANVARNAPKFEFKGSSLTLLPYCWGEDSSSIPIADVILAADVIYAERLYSLLIVAINQILRPDGGILIITYAQRSTSCEKRFIDLLEENNFILEIVDKREITDQVIITMRGQRRSPCQQQSQDKQGHRTPPNNDISATIDGNVDCGLYL